MYIFTWCCLATFFNVKKTLSDTNAMGGHDKCLLLMTRGGGGVEKSQKPAYVIHGCSLTVYFQFLNIEMVVLKVLQEFACGTRIHGFKFLVSPKSSPRTKIIWAISIVVALSYASWEMRNSVISKYHYTLPTPWLTQVWFTQISPT